MNERRHWTLHYAQAVTAVLIPDPQPFVSNLLLRHMSVIEEVHAYTYTRILGRGCTRLGAIRVRPNPFGRLRGRSLSLERLFTTCSFATRSVVAGRCRQPLVRFCLDPKIFPVDVSRLFHDTYVLRSGKTKRGSLPPYPRRTYPYRVGEAPERICWLPRWILLVKGCLALFVSLIQLNDSCMGCRFGPTVN